MATYASGVTANWSGTPFQEVVEIKINYGGSLPIGRSERFSLDLGTIEVSCLGSANVSASNWGERSTFSVTGGGLTFSHSCVYLGCRIDGTVNDVAKYLVTLKPIK